MSKEYDCRKISSIKIKYEKGKCIVFEIDGQEIGHKTTRAELKFDGTLPTLYDGTLPTLYIERLLNDCDIEIVADDKKPIWCDTKFLKPPTLDKQK